MSENYKAIDTYCRNSGMSVQKTDNLKRLYSEIYDVYESGTSASNDLERLLNETGFVEPDNALDFFERIGCKFNQSGSGYSKKNYSKKRRTSKRRTSKRRSSKRRTSKRRKSKRRKSKRRVYY